MSTPRPVPVLPNDVTGTRTELVPETILRDTRERSPWTFDDCRVDLRDVTLSTGDYAVPSQCTHDPERDTYHPTFAVERKSANDFLNAITWDRDRFTDELRRANGWSRPLSVVVEASWESLLRNRGDTSSRDVHPNQVVGTVSAWTRGYNVAFHFTGDRRRAELCGYLLLVRDGVVERVDG